MSDEEFKCPGCGKKLTSLESKFRDLRQKLREARNELEHLHGNFIGSKKRKHFHRSDCQYAKCILNSKDPGNVREFTSHRDAQEQGYKPCKTCCA